MYHQRLLQITIAAVAAMGTVLLSMGQRDMVLPLVMILAAGVSLWLTDIRALFHLNRTLSNLAMLLAAAISLRELWVYGSEIQAIGFARLLIYLQIIVLFQKKDARSYWLLIMLSLLQVIVAALYSQGVFFGLMLVIYMLTASLGLTLLLFQRQWEQFAPGQKSVSAPAGGRWPLAGQQPEFSSVPAGSINACLGRELYRRLTGIGMRTLGVTVVLFVFLPRYGQVSWIGSIEQAKQIVGFNDQVNLGELGQIIENRDEIMRIRFFYGKNSDETYKVRGPIYLRGAVLMNYRRGQWSVGKPAVSPGNATLLKIRALPRNLVRQECAIEGLDRPELFYVAPYVPIKDNLEITVDDSRLRLLRSEYWRIQQFKYVLGTTALSDGVQLPLVPRDEKEDRVRGPLRMPRPDGPNALPNLVRLARQWIEESGLPEDDRVGRARYLEQKLAFSGLFRYSLEGQPRDPALDPIEDFLAKNRAGHCEYFATALTLMLRSQNIPARMVVGYRTDEWNQVGQCFQVRQLHAHTWVECWLRPRQIPPELLHGQDYWPWSETGAWLQLDPTPEGDASSQSSWYSPIKKTFQWFNYAWAYYVVELNYERQRNAIFQPIAQAATFVYKWLADAQTWRNLFAHIGKALHLGGLAGAIAWALLFAAILAGAALLAFLCRTAWRLADKLWRKLSGRAPKHRRRPQIEVEFYRRLETLLAARGLVRKATETQREFARWAGAKLAALSGKSSLALLPLRVADAFYRVRFGRLPLDSDQQQAVEHALAQIAACDKMGTGSR
jgi:hypothetical protein